MRGARYDARDVSLESIEQQPDDIFGHTNEQYELSMYSFQLAWYVSFLLQKPVHKSLNIDDIPPRFSKNLKFVCFIGNY